MSEGFWFCNLFVDSHANRPTYVVIHALFFDQSVVKWLRCLTSLFTIVFVLLSMVVVKFLKTSFNLVPIVLTLLRRSEFSDHGNGKFI